VAALRERAPPPHAWASACAGDFVLPSPPSSLEGLRGTLPQAQRRRMLVHRHLVLPWAAGFHSSAPSSHGPGAQQSRARMLPSWGHLSSFQSSQVTFPDPAISRGHSLWACDPLRPWSLVHFGSLRAASERCPLAHSYSILPRCLAPPSCACARR
jgi:hypothetical protein